MIWYVIACFVAMAALDFVWARYTASIAEKRRVPAALYASLITLFNGTLILSLKNPWMMIPAVLGAFVGTFFGVKR